MFFYSDTASGSATPINIWKMNGSAAYLRHFDNYLFLNFMAKNGTRAERYEAEKEIVICRRKLAFWKRHPNYEEHVVKPEVEKKIKEWKGRA